jgi:ubiquinone/menaquinone biosynthesis C-methylase UbiE
LHKFRRTVDYDEEMVAQANKNAQLAGVSDWVSHRYADATQLPFEPNFFDSCRSERLLQHLEEPDQALKEMLRVTKPGGWIVVVDTDWGTMSADTSEPEIARRLWDFKATDLHNNGFSGRKLFSMFKQQQLVDIVVEPYVYYSIDYGFARWMIMADELEQKAIEQGILTLEELNKLTGGFKKASKEGHYFGTLGGVMVAGRKQ